MLNSGRVRRNMGGMEFKEKIAKLCDIKEWTKVDLARKVRVSPSTVGNWMSGERKPKWEMIPRIADAFADLGVTERFLLRDDLDEPEPTLSVAEDLAVRMVRRYGYEDLEVTERLAPRRAVGHHAEAHPLDVPPGHVTSAHSVDPVTGRRIEPGEQRTPERKRGRIA